MLFSGTYSFPPLDIRLSSLHTTHGLIYLSQTVFLILRRQYMQSYTCPNCGAPVKMDDHGAFLECPYCGSQFKPDDSSSDESSSRQTDSDDDNKELRTYAEIVNRHIPEFSVTEFIDRAKHILERTLDFLGDYGMYIQVGVVLLFVALAIASFFL